MHIQKSFQLCFDSYPPHFGMGVVVFEMRSWQVGNTHISIAPDGWTCVIKYPLSLDDCLLK